MPNIGKAVVIMQGTSYRIVSPRGMSHVRSGETVLMHKQTLKLFREKKSYRDEVRYSSISLFSSGRCSFVGHTGVWRRFGKRVSKIFSYFYQWMKAIKDYRKSAAKSGVQDVWMCRD